MPPKLTVACLQITSGSDIAENLGMLAPMIAAAKGRGVEFIATPETTDFRTGDRAKLFATAHAEADHPALLFFCHEAQQHKVWILAGSLVIRIDEDKLANRSFLFAPDGTIRARYDKIHMFDAELPNGEHYSESKKFHAGNKVVAADTPWGKIGLTICYDMRFAYLYRALAKMGANIITVPAAFTVPTGKLHWHVLLRARAIETGCFIIAPAQCGTHEGGRMTYGHSLIVAPSGAIIAEASETPEIIIAELDLTQVDAARRMLPSLQHDRAFAEQ